MAVGSASLAHPSEKLTRDWPTYYGLQLHDVGEDGAVVVLGHPEDERRVVAAVNRHYREFWGCSDVFDGCAGTHSVYREARECLTKRWARFVEPEPGDGEWRIDWSFKSTDPDVFAITVFGP